eukprot:g3756.t1
MIAHVQVFWEILQRDKRQTLMRIGEDVIWERLHALLLRQNLCVGCQEAVYRDVEVLKEDLQERVGPCFIEVSKRSVCLREDMLGDMDILCLLQRAAEVQSEEADDTLQDFGCPSVDSPALSYEYLVDVVAVVFKEHLEKAYADANAASLAMESLLLEEENRKDTTTEKKKAKRKKKKKKSKKKKKKGDTSPDAQSPTETVSSSSSPISKSLRSARVEASAGFDRATDSLTADRVGDDDDDKNDDTKPTFPVPFIPKNSADDATGRNRTMFAPPGFGFGGGPSLLSQLVAADEDESGGCTEEVDREVEAFKRMLMSGGATRPNRPKIKVALPKGALSGLFGKRPAQ